MKKNLFTVCILSVAAMGWSAYGQANPPATLEATNGHAASITYLRDVKPIVMGKCLRCHNQETTKLPNWGDYKTAFADRWELKRRVWDSWKGHYYKQSMPAGNSPESEEMTKQERQTIKNWVEEGAVYGVPETGGLLTSKAEKIEAGKRLFNVVCAVCHQPTGLGLPDKFPPLAGSDFLNADKKRAIGILLHGRQGQIVVNGKSFNNSMPSFPLGDEDIANALTFVYNSFGNSGKEVTADEVKALRAQKQEAAPPSNPGQLAKTAKQNDPWE